MANEGLERTAYRDAEDGFRELPRYDPVVQHTDDPDPSARVGRGARRMWAVSSPWPARCTRVAT